MPVWLELAFDFRVGRLPVSFIDDNIASRLLYRQMDALLTTSEVAERMRLSPNTVKELWRSGRLPGIRVSERKLRFRSVDVENFLRAGRNAGTAPVDRAYRTEEQAFCREKLEELRALGGQWVVIEGSRLVEHDVDPVRAVERARRRGISSPYVFFVPGQSSASIQMGL